MQGRRLVTSLLVKSHAAEAERFTLSETATEHAAARGLPRPVSGHLLRRLLLHALQTWYVQRSPQLLGPPLVYEAKPALQPKPANMYRPSCHSRCRLPTHFLSPSLPPVRQIGPACNSRQRQTATSNVSFRTHMQGTRTLSCLPKHLSTAGSSAAMGHVCPSGILICITGSASQGLHPEHSVQSVASRAQTCNALWCCQGLRSSLMLQRALDII